MTEDSEEIVLGFVCLFGRNFVNVELAKLLFLLLPGTFREHAIGVDAKEHSRCPPDGCEE